MLNKNPVKACGAAAEVFCSFCNGALYGSGVLQGSFRKDTGVRSLGFRGFDGVLSSFAGFYKVQGLARFLYGVQEWSRVRGFPGLGCLGFLGLGVQGLWALPGLIGFEIAHSSSSRHTKLGCTISRQKVVLACLDKACRA